MQKITFQDAVDILVGCTILGTGGGGSLQSGIDAVKKTFEAGNSINMIDFDEIEDNAYYINPYYCGTVTPENETNEDENELSSAITALEEFMNVNFEGVVSIEYGGGNTAQAMVAAAQTGKYIVDADAAGRAVPELQFSTYYITNQPIYPFSIATKHGDAVIFTKVQSDARAEILSRMMAVVTDNSVGIADHPIKGKELKKSVIPNALSYAGKVGKIQRESREKGLDPISEIIKFCNGKVLFNGVVDENNTNWQIKDGFTVGTIGVRDKDISSNSKLKIWYKNENMIAWLNDEVILTCPDLICVLNSYTGYPITNPNCKPGENVTILGFKAHDLWKTEKGMSILNPNFFGFDIDPVFL
jgi:uncharacterized protein